MYKKQFNADDEPEGVGLIQSTPLTEQELQDMSLFIAQSKQRNGSVGGVQNPDTTEKALSDSEELS